MTDTFQDTLQSAVIIMQIFEHNVPPCATDLEFLKLNAQSSLKYFNQVCDNVFNFMPKAYFKKKFFPSKEVFHNGTFIPKSVLWGDGIMQMYKNVSLI